MEAKRRRLLEQDDNDSLEGCEARFRVIERESVKRNDKNREFADVLCEKEK